MGPPGVRMGLKSSMPSSPRGVTLQESSTAEEEGGLLLRVEVAGRLAVLLMAGGLEISERGLVLHALPLLDHSTALGEPTQAGERERKRAGR